MNETKRNPKTTRAKTPTCHRSFKKRVQFVGSIKENRLFSKLGIPLATDVQTRWRGVLEIKAGARKTDKTEAQSKTCSNPDFTKRCTCLWLPNGPMDHKASSRSNRETIRGRIPSESSMAFSNLARMELPETGEASAGARRGSHSALETLQMAIYKKTQNGLVPIWCFLTKAVFCLYQVSVAPGRLGGKPLTCLWQAIGLKYPPFLQSVFLPKETMLLFISSFIPVKTYVLQKWNDFCVIFFITLKDLLCSFGIAVGFTEPRLLQDFLYVTKGLVPISSQAILRNLILMNLYGLNLKELLRMLSPKICLILNGHYSHLYKEFVILKSSYGHASVLPICHGNDLSITFA